MEVVHWQYNQHLIMEPDAAHAGFAQHSIPLGTQYQHKRQQQTPSIQGSGPVCGQESWKTVGRDC